MTPEVFDQTMRKFVKTEPFQPFVVELLDARTIDLTHPHIAFGGGTAGFVSEDGVLIEVNCEDVRGFRPATREKVS